MNASWLFLSKYKQVLYYESQENKLSVLLELLLENCSSNHHIQLE